MKNKCTKCGKDMFGITCSNCEYKETKITILIFVVTLFIAFAILISAKYAWAIYAYNDWRCMFSECRLIK